MFARPSRCLALGVIAILPIACATGPAPVSPSASAPPPPSSAPSEAPSAAPGSLLLKVTSEGGFINPSATLAALPIVAVYTDGRIMTPRPAPAIDPAPLLPAVSVRDVGSNGAAAILAAIRTVGLDKPASGGPGVPGDSGTDVFTVVADGVTTTSRFAGGGPGGPGVVGGGGSGDPEEAAAIDLLNRLLDTSETWGSAVTTERIYTPTGYLIFVAPGSPAAEASAGGPSIAWPLTTPLDQFGAPASADRGITGLRQGAAVGADAATLAPLLQSATVLTPFTSNGQSYTLFARPLLPDESGS